MNYLRQLFTWIIYMYTLTRVVIIDCYVIFLSVPSFVHEPLLRDMLYICKCYICEYSCKYGCILRFLLLIDSKQTKIKAMFYKRDFFTQEKEKVKHKSIYIY